MRLWRFIKIDDTHKTHITLNISVAKLILIKFLYILILLQIGLIIFSICSFLFFSQILYFSWWFVYTITLYMNGNIYNSLFAKNLYGIMKFFIELFWEVMFFMIFNVHILVGGVVAYTFMVVIDLLVLSIDAIPFFLHIFLVFGVFEFIMAWTCSTILFHLYTTCTMLPLASTICLCNMFLMLACYEHENLFMMSVCLFLLWRTFSSSSTPSSSTLMMKPLALSLICLALSISIPFFESSTIAMVLAS